MMNHGVEQQTFHHARHMEETDMIMDENDYSMYAEEDEINENGTTPRAVHQCNVCNKIFVSFKGLQQHAVIHTDQKPFQCDICAKAFRFKSNLFEHRSVHTGYTPHHCPYCGKTCRLKGNLKKHLRTHVTTKEELEIAWRPFASNRRPPADIPEDAIIVRGTGGPFYATPIKPRKKKNSDVADVNTWVSRITSGEILPLPDVIDKLRRLEEHMYNSMTACSTANIFEVARAISFEQYECPACKIEFGGRFECEQHLSIEHANFAPEHPLFCAKCVRVFSDISSFQQHESYHDRVIAMISNRELPVTEPQLLVPTPEELSILFNPQAKLPYE